MDDKAQVLKLVVSKGLKEGEGVVDIVFSGILNDKMAGFYRSEYSDGDGNKKIMGVTQFEATDARRAFPCWDEVGFVHERLIFVACS